MCPSPDELSEQGQFSTFECFPMVPCVWIISMFWELIWLVFIAIPCTRNIAGDLRAHKLIRSCWFFIAIVAISALRMLWYVICWCTQVSFFNKNFRIWIIVDGLRAHQLIGDCWIWIAIPSIQRIAVVLKAHQLMDTLNFRCDSLAFRTWLTFCELISWCAAVDLSSLVLAFGAMQTFWQFISWYIKHIFDCNPLRFDHCGLSESSSVDIQLLILQCDCLHLEHLRCSESSSVDAQTVDFALLFW